MVIFNPKIYFADFGPIYRAFFRRFTKAGVCCCPHSNVVGIPQDLIADQRSDLNPASDHKGAMHISLFLCLCILPHKHPDQGEEISAELCFFRPPVHSRVSSTEGRVRLAGMQILSPVHLDILPLSPLD